MKFKRVAFLAILSILFFNACDSNKQEEENSTEKQSTTSEKKEIVKPIKTDFSITTTNDNIIDIKLEDEKVIIRNYTDKVVLLNFFATWCPPCVAEIPNLVELQREYKNDFKVISVLLEDDKSNENIKKFMKEHKINYTVINSEDNFELARSLGGVKSIPTMFLIDKHQKIFQKYVGLVPAEMMDIDIKKTLAEE